MRSLIGMSFVCAFVLMVVPISYQWRWCRPEFVALLIIYWTLYAPQNFGLVAAWGVGLCQDLLELVPLGFNGLGILVIAYIVYMVHQRIRNYMIWHQSLWVFVLVGVYLLFSNWLGSFVGRTVDRPVFLLSAVLSALCWPFLVVLMSRLAVRFRLVQ
ncbi:MAG: rod shape-determining protein MreD [Pseudomonadota bacterium]